MTHSASRTDGQTATGEIEPLAGLGGADGVVPAIECDLARASVRRALFGAEHPSMVLGRFRIERRLGEGAMGVVYAAHDPRLRRTVALKVLHRGGDVGLEERRVLREAQAIARFNHPNVVQVYEVGASDGHVFMAMEYVAGPTLRAWIAAERPHWTRVLELLLQAGDGLAAAHRHGLVHRDFKPDNVLVDGESRARIVDFGLASAIDELEVTWEEPALDRLGGTTNRSIAGTPRYMAPEQLAGAIEADARGDLYAFCAAAYECLTGSPAFVGETLAALYAAKCQGPPQRRGDLGIPRWLLEVIEIGLATDPTARHESMAALLTALRQRQARARRRRWLGASGVGLFAAGTVGLLGGRSLSDAAIDPCADVTRAIDGIWSEDARASVRAALATRDDDEGGERVARHVDAWAAQWREVRSDACTSTHGGSRSDAAYDLQLACTDRALDGLRGLIETVGHTGVGPSDATEAVARLPRVEACRDLRWLTSVMVMPADPRRADEVRAIQRELATNAAVNAVGRFEQALATSESLVARADATGHAPTLAEALEQRAADRVALGATEQGLADLEQAALAAERGGDDRRKAEVWNSIASVAAKDLGDVPRAEQALRNAQATIARLDVPIDLAAENAEVEGLVCNARGDHDGALAAFERAWELAVTARGADHPRNAAITANLGAMYFMRGDYPRALAQFDRALEITRATVGADHPDVAIVMSNRATVRGRMGDEEGHLADYREALAMLRRTLGDEHPSVAQAYSNLGSALTGMGRLDEAAPALERALAIYQATLPEDHAQLVMGHWELGRLHAHAKRNAEALVDFTAALAVAERTDDPGNVVLALRGVASTERALGRFTEARRDFVRANDIALAADQPALMITDVAIDRIELELEVGDVEAAARVLAAARRAVGMEGPPAADAALDRAAQSIAEHRPRRVSH